jgi:hypothetical protein
MDRYVFKGKLQEILALQYMVPINWNITQLA